LSELTTLLSSALGDSRRVSDGESDRDLHSRDVALFTPVRPDVVVYPETTEEVARVLALADERGIAVTPFGIGSSLEGHVIPIAGGISLDLTRMSRILSIEPENLQATVQPGVTRNKLNTALVDHGLQFPVDPGADATLGGMAATNASGTTTVRYGKMRAQILALEAVLPNGRVIRTGSRAPKTSAGYDLTGLLVGSEGTLGVITELTLKVYGIPERAVALRIAFPSVDSAVRAAVTAVGTGTGVTRLELMDPWTIRLINGHCGTSYAESPCLLVECSGSETSVDGDLALVIEIAEHEGATDIAYERLAEGRSQLWSARHSAADAMGSAYPGRRHRSTDVCVPISELPGAIDFARSELTRLDIPGGILGHVGDGNFHVSVMLDPDDPREIWAYGELSDRVVDYALARGGTCTGEHGVGMGKVRALAREHPDTIELMRGVKAVFDPNGIMNPGKVVAAY
jgi:D-lactate dehydrogenase (cytochrome)